MRKFNKCATGFLLGLLLCISLSACTEAGGTYKIEFETNGGSAISDIYLLEGEYLSDLPIPEKTGYVFYGWYDNADFSGYNITFLNADKNYKLYAKWLDYSKGLEFSEIENGTAYSVKITSAAEATEILMPATYESKPVTTVLKSDKYDNSIFEKITLGSNITTLGNAAFLGFAGLTEIILPNSLNAIGDYAFSGCVALTSLTIPDSVGSIGSCAFLNCTELISITLPENLNTLETELFSGCEKLTNVNVPLELDSIGNGVFQNCRSLIEITIPDSIGALTVNHRNLFAGCESLQALTVPTVNTNYFADIFNSNVPASLKSVIFTKMTQINFSGCSDIESIVFQKGSQQCIFPDTISLKYLDLGTAEYLLPGALENCTSLESLIIPFIGRYPEDDIYFDESTTYLGHLFGAINYSNNAKYVPSSLTSVTVTMMKKIPDYAFSGLNNLTYINIGDAEEVGQYAFSVCSKLENIDLGKNLQAIGDGAFRYSGIKTIKLPETLTFIGREAFLSAPILTNVAPENIVYADNWVIGHTIQSYGTYTLDMNTVGIAAWAFKSLPDCNLQINSKLKYVNELAFQYTTVKSISLPDTVEEIGMGAFSNSQIWYCTFPVGIKEIPDYAFNQCTMLGSFIIPDTVEYIGIQAFDNCTSLLEIDLPSNLKVIGRIAFSGCTKINSIAIPSSVVSIGDNAFSNTAVQNNATKGAVFYIDNWALSYIFSSVGQPTSITFIDGTIGISDSLLLGFTQLTSVTLPKSLKYLGNSMFEYCERLNAINYNGTLAEWAEVEIGENNNYNITVYCTDGNVRLI